jgi:hypothetical protein
MSMSHAEPEPSQLPVTVYTGDRLLAEATCALWLTDHPKHGTMAVSGEQNWLRFDHLTLRAIDGNEYVILPKRLEHTGGEAAVLVFDIE